MDRLKSARGGGGVGGRIEGMGKVAGTGGGGWFSKMFGGGRYVVISDANGDDHEDEGLTWGGKGPFRWEDVEGVDVEWGVSGLGMVNVGKEVVQVKGGEKGDGLNELKAFLLGL